MMDTVAEEVHYTRTQQEALKLLGIIDRVCQQERIRYSLSGNALVWQHLGYDFNMMNPNTLSVCLPYPDYLRLVGVLEREQAALGLSLADCRRRDNFDTFSTWVIRNAPPLLPKGREQDEIYYCTRLFLQPIFPAGNTEWERLSLEKKIRNTFRLLNARSPLPHKRWFHNIKAKIKRSKARYYCWQRKKLQPNVNKLLSFLVETPRSDNYLLWRDESGHLSWITGEELRFDRVNFFGVDTYAFADAQTIIARNYPKRLEEPPDRQVSDLLLRGGRDLRRVQLIQFEMLVELDRICRKYDLKYNIAFGTLLGAVRHKGFVPWDDDADINMPYEDYEKLKQVIEQELDHEKYYFRIQEKEPDCNITYAHLKRNGTIYTKPDREGFRYHPGVYVDIVPIFNGAPNFFLHMLQTRICWFFRTACWAHMGANSEKKLWKRNYYQLIAKIGNKKAYQQFIRFATICRHTREKMAFFNGMDRSPYNVAFVRRECYDHPVEVEFEGHMFYAPSDINGVLEYCYGKDYMMAPVLLNRRPKMNARISLGGLYADLSC